MKRLKKAMLMPWAGGRGITYLLRDQFSTAESAPIASPRTCEPGPGTLTIVDTGNKVSITGAGLHFASQTVSQTDPIVKDTATRARVPGRTFRITTTAFKARMGWAQSGSTSADAIGITHSTGGIFVFDGLTTRGALFTLADSTQYTLECVMRDQGGMVFIQGGAYTQRTLLWVESGNDLSDLTTTPLRAMLGYSNTGIGVITSTDWQEIDYGGAWGARFGLATDYKLYNTAPITLNANADCLIEVVWFITTGEALEIRFRRVDDDNCWLLRCTQADSTVKLFTRVAGVETEFQAGKTRTFSNASRQRITIRCEGTRIITATAGIIQHNVTDTYNQTTAGLVKVSGTTYVPMCDTFPLTGFPEPTQANPPKNILCHGDSKTGGVGDSTPPPSGYNGYVPILIDLLTTATGGGWYERPARIATAGAGVTTLKGTVDASLASAIGTPDYILTNMGINDSAVLPTEATWKSDYGYILDAFHTKWPSAIIKVAYIWAIGRDANCATLNSWIDTVLSTRPWASVGLNEQVVLKGSDNGASEMSDTVHPNRLGYTLTAAAWKVSIGL